MKFSFLKFIFVFFFLFHLCYSQNLYSNLLVKSFDIYSFYTENQFSIKSNGKGLTGVADKNDIFGSIINPATFYQNEKFKIGLGYSYKNNLELNSNVEYQYIHPSFFIGAGYKIYSYVQTGLIFYTKRSYRVNYSGWFSDYIDSHTYNISIPLMISITDYISVGINLNYQNSRIVTHYESNREERNNSDMFTARFGILYSPLENLSLGLSFFPEFIDKKKERETDIDGSNSIIETHYYYPQNLKLGISYTSSSFPLIASIDYSYFSVPDGQEYKDKYKLNFGFEYTFSSKLNLRVGTFYQHNYESTTDINSIINEFIDQYYLTTGITYKLENFNILFSVMDSHLLTSGKGKQTFIHLGTQCALF